MIDIVVYFPPSRNILYRPHNY